MQLQHISKNKFYVFLFIFLLLLAAVYIWRSRLMQLHFQCSVFIFCKQNFIVFCSSGTRSVTNGIDDGLPKINQLHKEVRFEIFFYFWLKIDCESNMCSALRWQVNNSINVNQSGNVLLTYCLLIFVRRLFFIFNSINDIWINVINSSESCSNFKLKLNWKYFVIRTLTSVCPLLLKRWNATIRSNV